MGDFAIDCCFFYTEYAESLISLTRNVFSFKPRMAMPRRLVTLVIFSW
jgi:hypothetical protein